MATSGLIVMARGLAVQRQLSQLFERREIRKRYQAVVHGCLTLPPDADNWSLIDLPIAVDWPRRPLRIIDPLLGKPSQTRWRTLAHDPAANTTRVELEPLTGRSHQLRVHLQALGHPMLGDTLYAPVAVQSLAPRLLLHACELQFTHPVNGSLMELSSDPDF